ncbi:hypothetical protein BDQ17DRAFT_1332510 [Cyathus striatus]|nr:hypothetical protein BDQ17DRAFT_1332510 [Cyathus striatus]
MEREQDSIFDTGVIPILLALSVLYYDHILTFGDEVNFIWKRQKRGSAYWFFINRYVACVGNVLVAISFFSPSLETEVYYTKSYGLFSLHCKRFYIFREGLLVFNQLAVSIILTLRIHVLYECSLRILFFMLTIGAGLLVVILWSLVGQHSAQSQIGTGCHIVSSQETIMSLTNLLNILTYYISIPFFTEGSSTLASRILVTSSNISPMIKDKFETLKRSAGPAIRRNSSLVVARN